MQEKSHTQERIHCPSLVEGKGSETHDTGAKQEYAAQRVFTAQFHQAVQHRQRRDAGPREADPVERPGRGWERGHRRQETARKRNCDEAQRHHHEKDRTPAEVFDQDAADHRTNRGGEHRAEPEHAERAPLLVSREFLHDHYVRDRHENARCDAFEHARHDYERVAAGQAARDLTRQQQNIRPDVGLAQPVAMQQPRGDQQRQGRRCHERRGDPLDAVLPYLKVSAYVRHRHVDDRGRHHRRHHADHYRQQDQPPEARAVAFAQTIEGSVSCGIHAMESMVHRIHRTPGLYLQYGKSWQTHLRAPSPNPARTLPDSAYNPTRCGRGAPGCCGGPVSSGAGVHNPARRTPKMLQRSHGQYHFLGEKKCNRLQSS